nr:ribonuclease H-like domain-containing protein [Tanacetum cinerariifolium]
MMIVRGGIHRKTPWFGQTDHNYRLVVPVWKRINRIANSIKTDPSKGRVIDRDEDAVKEAYEGREYTIDTQVDGRQADIYHIDMDHAAKVLKGTSALTGAATLTGGAVTVGTVAAALIVSRIAEGITAAALTVSLTAATTSGNEHPMFELELEIVVVVEGIGHGMLMVHLEVAVVVEMKGIKREFSVPRTPQQNGIAERKNRTLIEAARTMLVDSLLPIPFWAEAINTACYV